MAGGLKRMKPMMKAMYFEQYGGPEKLSVKEIERPTAKKGQLMIKVHTAASNPADWHILRADPSLVRLMFGLFKPKVNVLGADVAGVVEEVGEGVEGFKVGDMVCGDIGTGGYAEYAAADASRFVAKPENLSFEEAAALPLAGVTAMEAMKAASADKMEKGTRVLINGASGGVGLFAVQIAKIYGLHVTATCSTPNVDLVHSVGADVVIDYKKDDFMKAEKFQVIIDNAFYRPLKDFLSMLNPKGSYILVGGASEKFLPYMMFQSPWVSMTKNVSAKICTAEANQPQLKQLMAWAESGQVRPTIGSRYTFEQIPEVLALSEQGHTRGKMVIEIS